MAKKRRSWTILFIPDDESGTRQFRLSAGAMRLLVGLGALLVVLIGLGIATYGRVARVAVEVREVKEENADLMQEVQKVWELEQLMGDLLETDYKIRSRLGVEMPEDWPGFRYRLGSLPDSAVSGRTAITETALPRGTESEVPESVPGSLLFAWPVRGYVTSEFGEGAGSAGSAHTGLDIAASSGTIVRAAADGRVVFAGTDESYGNLLEIDHGEGMITRYGHSSRLTVREGQIVSKGDIIAYVGSSGRVTTGPHLHFEVQKDGRSVDPRRYLPRY
ncbi:MAG: M23 family metallopeptidase [bacterium]